MNVKKISIIFTLSFISACSNLPKHEISYDYVITSASTDHRPEWIDSEYIQKLNNKKDGYVYFIGENDNLASQKTKNLCKNSSEAQAKKDLASAIAMNVKSVYKEIENTSNDDENIKSVSDFSLETNIENVISGAAKVKNYWEERTHKVSLNAIKDYKSYTCFSMIRLSDTTYKEAISVAVDVMMKNLKQTNSDLKSKLIEKSIKLDAVKTE